MNGLKACAISNYEGNFVAAAVKIDKSGTPTHAGLLISSDEGVYLCHFDGASVRLDSDFAHDWYFFKLFSFIDDRLCGAFLGECKVVLEGSQPIKGYYYEGSFWKEGRYFSDIEQKQYMTCVGFCLSILKGFLCEKGEEFFEYTDWSSAEIDRDYLELFVKKLKFENPAATISDLKENVRRILPIEYLASAFLPSWPIRRKDLAPLLREIDLELKSKVLAA